MNNKISSSIAMFSALCVACGSPSTTQEDSGAIGFRKHVLTSEFISEGVAIGDVNGDGKPDVIAGAYWFEAPEWKRHEIFPGKAFNGAKGYSNSFLNFSLDVDQDGSVDLVLVDFPGTPGHWYRNPGESDVHWRKYGFHPGVVIGNESPAFVDIDGDGRQDLLFADSDKKQMVWLRAPSVPGDTLWTKSTISELDAPGTDRFSHGLGFGDINGDGRGDVVIRQGWWEGGTDPTAPNWTFHPAELGEDCSQMHVFDVNADGLADVISASAHRYGIWWYEQGRDAEGNMTWTKHTISSEFSQSHASLLADIDQDGTPDLLVGKRYYAHNDSDADPGRDEPAVLYWYKITPGQAPYFHANLVDDDSGSGLNIAAADINGDGRVDIATANKKGVFVFEQVVK